MTDLRYLSGFRNHFESESIPGALPDGRNSPQKPAHGLFAEQLSGSAFTAPRESNLKSWLYRRHPSVGHSEFKLLSGQSARWISEKFSTQGPNPNPMRWNPLPYPSSPTDWIEGMVTYAGNGGPNQQLGLAMHLYAANVSMTRVFQNSDAEMILVPQEGRLLIKTEFGRLEVAPLEIVLLPRGMKFQIELLDGKARGYTAENFGTPFRLPELGPIGANGLANPRDFESPVAWAEGNGVGPIELVNRFCGRNFLATLSRTPFDVVAWHGNYVPAKYDLRKFNTIGSISFDHPDPSIFTVLTSPTTQPGVANCDFVIFPPRWMVAQDTFRPPYYHRNIMSEFMGLIHGVYDAKPNGFAPGGASLHNCMTPHGPDAESFRIATEKKLTPEYYDHTMAFMFETRLPFEVTDIAIQTPHRQSDYVACWAGL